MRTLFISILCSILSATPLLAQEEIEWSSDVKLTLADFWSPATRLNSHMISLHPGSRIGLAYQMSSYEFAFRKNFNDKVEVRFVKTAAALNAPDSATAFRLVKLAQYDFDLCELYARKMRKRLFEEKGLFSDAKFFQPVFNEIEKERGVEYNNTVSETEFGRIEDLLQQKHEAVKTDIGELSAYCKECKPSKKRK